MTKKRLNDPMLSRIKRELSSEYPALHVKREQFHSLLITGTFPVYGACCDVIDRFQVRIELPHSYPKDLPVVKETGGRIPWTDDRHINPDGTACVMMPEERYRVWPIGSNLRDFLNGPLRNFFLGQLARERGEPWPFGEWSHGDLGFLEFVHNELGTTDRDLVVRFMLVVSQDQMRSRSRCPCRSGRSIRDCCKAKIIRLRRIIGKSGADRLLGWLIASISPSELRGFTGSTRSLRDWSTNRFLLKSSVPIPISVDEHLETK